MPRISHREGSHACKATSSLIQPPVLTFLLPGFYQLSTPPRDRDPSRRKTCNEHLLPSAGSIEQCFYSALTQAGSCHRQRSVKLPKIIFNQNTNHTSSRDLQRRWLSACRVTKNEGGDKAATSVDSPSNAETASGSERTPVSSQIRQGHESGPGSDEKDPFFKPFYEELDHGSPSIVQNDSTSTGQSTEYMVDTKGGLKPRENATMGSRSESNAYDEMQNLLESEDTPSGVDDGESLELDGHELSEQIQYLRTVRDLEKKLEEARHNLHTSMKNRNTKHRGAYWQEEAYQDQQRIERMNVADAEMTPKSRPTVKLKKEDYLDLVDMYFYSHRSRFLSESPDASPTPLQLDDYSFKVSEDFSPPTNPQSDLVRDEEGTPVSPLYHVEAEIKAWKMKEVKTLQTFVDLLLDDYSPLKELFDAYKALPQPGVTYLSGGIIRLFLQRMSTPWRKSEKAMLRYLSLLDDMQLAGLPITAWEWSSGIYLAGQSFNNVSNTDVAAAFRVWRQMEKDAGVAARAVTFNILFDITVKAEKFVLAEQILKEMHDRGFRLNRLGRVSLIYYYGKKGDGDGVRKAYRDFVEAGEIVDTLVLNCVMASLINAQEPVAAEQIYERMKGMQERLRRGKNADGEEALFLKYPPPGPDKIGTEVASNALGRVLLKASRLKTSLPEHHAELQDAMPLTPDATTYRILMSHHAKTSGNIDRLTVLLDDMTRQFRIPMTHLTFQFLFRGFAMHGGSDRSDAKWTRQRLQIAWAACLVCMKASKVKDVATSQKALLLELPSVEEAEAIAAEDEERAKEEASNRPKPRRPTAWDTFIKQFATPYPETKPFDLYSTSLDTLDSQTENEGGAQEEYKVPDVELRPKTTSSEDSAEIYSVQPNRHLALWVIRAFTRCTASRSVLEDVWYQLTRVWRPSDFGEKAIAIRELRRALKYCDTHER